MKYAIISDVHGNIDALNAVLKDAGNFDAVKYIFVGDYCSYFPYPNEAVDMIKGLENSIVMKGNEDACLSEYAKQDRRLWTDGQFQAHYWCFREITGTNLSYLSALPEFITFTDGDVKITAAHSSSDIVGDVEHKEFSSLQVAEKYRNDPDYSREILLDDIREYIHREADTNAAVRSLTDGIYIFGHTHVQWHARHKNKIFINPGSCGLPLDGIAGAPYTLLNIEKSRVTITERRVPYDMDETISNYRSSGLYNAAPVWSNVILQEITTGFAQAWPFLKFVNDYANKINDPIRPFSVGTWTGAYDLWRKDNNLGMSDV